MSDAVTSGTPTPQASSEMEEVAASAEAARGALVRLSTAAQRIPGVKINLARAIELLEQLSARARRSAWHTDADDTLVRSLTASLAALQVSGAPLGPEKSAELEKQIRNALAKENGARGGKKMTDRKRAALARLHASRRAPEKQPDAPNPANEGTVSPDACVTARIGEVAGSPELDLF